jgi:hypothetical protein
VDFLLLYLPGLNRIDRISDYRQVVQGPNGKLNYLDHKFYALVPFERNLQQPLKALVYNLIDEASAVPAVPLTDVFCATVCQDLGFLFLVSCLGHERDDKAEFFDAWIDAVGPRRLRNMLHFIVWTNFKVLQGETLVFRGNSFLSLLFAHGIRSDPDVEKFLVALQSMDPQNAVEHFLRCFEAMRASPLVHLLLKCAFVEARRAFPGGDAPFYGVSGLMFLRVMMPRLFNDPGSRAQEALPALQNCYNFGKTDGVELPEGQRLKQIILNKIRAPPTHVVRPRLDHKGMNLLIRKAARNAKAMQGCWERDREKGGFTARYRQFVTEVLRETPDV